MADNKLKLLVEKNVNSSVKTKERRHQMAKRWRKAYIRSKEGKHNGR